MLRGGRGRVAAAGAVPRGAGRIVSGLGLHAAGGGGEELGGVVGGLQHGGLVHQLLRGLPHCLRQLLVAAVDLEQVLQHRQEVQLVRRVAHLGSSQGDR